jgi:predicted amidophosphoribosyltransferase
MDKIAPDKLLEFCPRCDYSLETMPVECRCPECGTQLDRRWQVIAPRGKTAQPNVFPRRPRGLTVHQEHGRIPAEFGEA